MLFKRVPGAGADRSVHARKLAAAGEHQRDGVLGDRGVAVARDGVNLDTECVERRNIHIARGAGAQEHDVPQSAAPGRTRSAGRNGRRGDVIAREQARQIGACERLAVQRDRRVVGRRTRAKTGASSLLQSMKMDFMAPPPPSNRGHSTV